MRTLPLLTLLVAAATVTPVAPARDNNRDHGGGSERSAGAGHNRDHVWSRNDPRPQYRVSHLPPPRRHEWQPHRPSYQHVWVPGCWRRRDGYNDWFWFTGYWCLPPREHVVYVQPYYQQVGSEAVFVDGGWCEESYAVDDGASTGTVIGGVLGGIIGHQSHNTGVGIIAGAIVGSLIGHEADRDRADRQAEAARDRAAQVDAARARADADARLEKEKLIAQGRTVTDQELLAAQERARIAKEKLAAAKAARDAGQRSERDERDAALGRAAALEKAKAEAAAAEEELDALERTPPATK
jgi:hypothetical protein